MESRQSIARALRWVGTDPEMWLALTDLEEALAVVLGSPEGRCEQCGGVSPEAARHTSALADRLDAVLHLLNQRLQPASEVQAPTADREAWARSRPDLAPDSRHSASRRGHEGGGR